MASDGLLGDNREIMRHSSGAIHAAIVERNGRMSLFGAKEFGEAMTRLVGPISGERSQGDEAPATDSNQNGTYVAYVQHSGSGAAGYLTHIPDPFGDPAEFRVYGPLTPLSGLATNSFLQASHAFDSLVYGWRDEKTGDLFVGVSSDGATFPTAQRVASDQHITRGPATGIHGDYVIFAYETTNPQFKPVDSDGGRRNYYVWCESGDGGESWSEPQPLFPESSRLPRATGYALAPHGDLTRSEVPIAAEAPLWDPSLQLLASANLEDPRDSRVFIMTTAVPAPNPRHGDWAGSDNSLGLLAFKPIEIGGEWGYAVTNRSLFRRTELTKPYVGRTGRLYKYSALPGTPIRVVMYVDKAPQGSNLEDQVAVLVSTTKGDSFDFETVFTASQLKLDRSSDVVISNSASCYADSAGDVWADLLVTDAKRPEAVLHAVLPIGINAQGLDPTLSW
jgi:hypothetical protein